MKKHLSNPKRPVDEKCNKSLLRMLGMVILILTINFSSFAVNENLLNERVQLQVDNVTLKDALKEIERQSEFTFLYNDASIDVNQVITVNTNELTVKELLDAILDDKGIEYTIIDNQIVLTRSAVNLQEKKTVTGVITDSETGEGLPGVTILEKGTSNGTITDLDGNYTLSIAEDGILIISYVGYVTEEINVTGMNEVSITMIPDIISLEDVVVIGYGTIRKSDLTGAVASISAEEMQQSAVSGLDQALQGRTAGVSITANSGSPGASPMVMIRGMGTITDPDPLFVVDGMPMSASAVGALNPGDIESTEILKDASAAAIYGSRAGNGVVLITTKKGKSGRTSVNFDAYTGIQSVTKTLDLVDATDFVTLRNAAGQTWEDSSLVSNTDWQAEIFRPAAISNYQLSFLGGTENINYALSGSYFDQEGIIKGSDYKRYTFRINTSANIKPWVTAGENISYIYSTQNIIPEEDEYTSVVITALTMDPAVPVYYPDASQFTNPNDRFYPAQRNNIRNPVGIIERNHHVLQTNKLLGNVFVDLKPVKWISLRTNFGVENTRQQREIFGPEYFESEDAKRPQNTLIKIDYNTTSLLWENTATIKKVFAEKHDITLLGGYTRELTSYRYMAGAVFNVPLDEDLWYFTNSTPDPNEEAENDFQDITEEIGGYRLEIPSPYDAALISYIGRLLYSYDGKYDINATIRRDGSSRFTGTDKWGIFPSFAAGWKISEEAFFKNMEFINFLKLRAGWGKLGNQQIGDYAAYTPVSYNINYSFGSYPQTSYQGGAPLGLGNRNLYWEETVMSNIGLDINFWNNKLAFNIDAYVRNTSDMLSQVPIPLVVGVTRAPYVNKGEVQNQGIEINGIFKEKRGDFSYSVGANIAFLKNEVTYLPSDIPGGDFRVGYVNLTQEGQPIASFYGYVTDGYWQTQEEIDAANALARQTAGDNLIYYDMTRTSPGDIKFKDLNGDDKINNEDLTFIGSPHPDMTYGISIDLQYKIFDLKIFGQGVYGNEVFFGPIFYLESPNAYWNVLSTMNDHWEQTGDDPSVPRLDYNNSNLNLRISDRYVYDGSYFRIKNVQLGVTLPDQISNKVGIERLRVYIASQNLLTFSKYPGFDPEIGRGPERTNSPAQLDMGIDRGLYPLARSYMVGVNLSF